MGANARLVQRVGLTRANKMMEEKICRQNPRRTHEPKRSKRSEPEAPETSRRCDFQSGDFHDDRLARRILVE
jgi:hypothetical protein